MLALLKNLYQKIESLRGPKLYATLAVIFICFIFAGLLIGYFITPKLNEDEKSITPPVVTQPLKEFQGRVRYTNPAFYPDDKVSYELVDSSGQVIVLLRSDDQKLAIAEGLVVKASGTIVKSKDGKLQILIVKELVIKNAAN